MVRDPLYRRIRRGLRELSDGDAFELCANDLLSRIHPSLAPREGGDDAGLDGLIVTDLGSSIQLICTVGKDVLGNLTGSIESNLRHGGKCHACILATSQRLTNPTKRVLEARAEQLGRPLIQIYDQAGIAQLLYRKPQWLKDLLGLAGDPPALSVFPVTTRPFLDVDPIGRDLDLAKILDFQQDSLVVGQPGSGKTHLLFSLAKRAKGYFVLNEDPTRIVDGIRENRPRFLIVDDAHSRLDLIKQLRYIRQQIFADFHITASCWPGQEEAVSAALQLKNDRVVALDGLPAKSIKAVINSQRIFGPEELVAEIIHQSQGKPGLAVTLCRLCWDIGPHDVGLGSALARDVRQWVEPLVGADGIHLLACFSLGGHSGVALERVAHLCGKTTLEAKRLVERLAAAGVLEVLEQNSIAVQPIRLRQALVRDTFLKPPLIDLTPYLAEVADFSAATRVLIQAKAVGGELDAKQLQERLVDSVMIHEIDAFKEYCCLGGAETTWILENFPAKLKAVAPMALVEAPERTATMLLDAALAERGADSALTAARRPAEILPEIAAWITRARSATEDAARRRELLANVLLKWSKVNDCPIVSVSAAALALAIKHESTSMPTGETNVVTFHFGVIDQSQLGRVAALFSTLLPILQRAELSQGLALADIFHAWIYPDFHRSDLSQEYKDQSRKYARSMMTELLEAVAGKWTHHYHLRRYAEELGLGSHISIVSTADILYPSHATGDWDAAKVNRQVAADRLVDDYLRYDPQSAVNQLVRFWTEATAANVSSEGLDSLVCERIAQRTSDESAWATTLLEHGAPAHFIQPFLERIVVTDPGFAENCVEIALGRPSLRAMAVHIVVKHYAPETRLWSLADRFFEECAPTIEWAVFRRDVGQDALRALLRSDIAAVAGRTAVGLWRQRSDPRIDSSLFEDWMNAFAQFEGEDHILEAVFREIPGMPFRWLSKRLQDMRAEGRAVFFGIKYERAMLAAQAVLTDGEKRQLLDKLPSMFAVSDLITSLVGRNISLFRHLLARSELGSLRLTPLQLELDSPERSTADVVGDWKQLAIAALDEGFAEKEISSAMCAGSYSWSGTMSSMYAAQLAPFEKLLQEGNPRLQAIGRIGAAHFSKLRDAHLAIEKGA